MAPGLEAVGFDKGAWGVVAEDLLGVGALLAPGPVDLTEGAALLAPVAVFGAFAVEETAVEETAVEETAFEGAAAEAGAFAFEPAVFAFAAPAFEAAGLDTGFFGGTFAWARAGFATARRAWPVLTADFFAALLLAMLSIRSPGASGPQPPPVGFRRRDRNIAGRVLRMVNSLKSLMK